MLASIPSPSSPYVPILGIRWYGLMIALGVFVSLTLARRRWAGRGHDPDELADIAVFAVPAGLIGARLYHVITDWNSLYSDGRWWPKAFQIWNGGLGIPGGIFLGVAVGLIVAKRYKIDIPSAIDAVTPVMPIAQAIGRLGNWFNQELYGRHSGLPWAVEISPANRCPSTDPNCSNAAFSTFHPTFLYEALWSVSAMFLMIWLDGKKVFRPGKMLPTYLFLYFTGRLWVESLRVDPATLVGGYRVNTLVSVAMMIVAAVWMLWGGALRTPDLRGVDLDLVKAEERERLSAVEDGAENVVADGGPEVERPISEVEIAETDEADADNGVDPDEGP